MFLLDNLLFSPVGATVWAARQVHHAIRQERAAEPQRITANLSELYMMLETGRLAEAEFNAREKELLDRLDLIQERENDSHRTSSR
jgi:Gas vesicle protein G